MATLPFKALGIDVGGTKIAAALLEFPGVRVVAEETILTNANRGGEAVLNDVRSMTRDFCLEDDVKAIGLGICELVDKKGNIASANCLAWTTGQVREQLEEFAPVHVEADVRAAALGEAKFGQGARFGNFLYVTIGTGISCCLMIEGRAYLGSRGATGTMASSPLTINCDQCGHVMHQTLEDVASGSGLVKQYREMGGLAGRGEDVLNAVANGERRANRVVAEGARTLGGQIGLLINTLDPEAVIVGGGLGLTDGIFWEILEGSIRKHVWSDLAKDLPILKAGLGKRAGVIGAAWEAKEKVEGGRQ